MKKYCRVWVFAMVLLLCLSVLCACDSDPYRGRRPTDQKNTEWVCEEYQMSFEVNDEGRVKNAVLNINDTERTFDLLWEGVPNPIMPDVIVFDPQDLEGDSSLFSGDCKFARNYFEITVTNDPYGFFPEGCTLRFERVDGE